MEGTKIYFKYDGQSDSIKNHQIDVRLLASTLENFADLIIGADEAVNNRESPIQVRAQAGFVQGSFGVELLVFAADPTLLEALGLVASAAGGGVLSFLRSMKGKKIETIEVDENSGLAKVLIKGHEPVETTATIARLIADPEVRTSIDRIVRQPLSNEGIESFSLFSDPDHDQEPFLLVESEESSLYKKPSTIQSLSKIETETQATIQFVQANKDSGTSGWRMTHISDEVSVRIEDAEFLLKIQRQGTPSIFASKYKVELTVVTSKRGDEVVRKTHKITKVIGPA